MSLKFGLNIKKKDPVVPVRKSIWDEHEDDEGGNDDVETAKSAVRDSRQRPVPTKKRGLNESNKQENEKPPGRSVKTTAREGQLDASSVHSTKVQIESAEQQDAAIFDYDSFHDAKSTIDDARKAAARQDAIDRKPKYINKLLDAAARRKQDQQVAKEKMLQRERETEGDEFADKDKFVTGAYKKQQEENRRLQEEEQKNADADEERRRRLGGGMQGFYRTMMDQTEVKHQEAMQAATELEKSGGVIKRSNGPHVKTDLELAADMHAKGVNVRVNEEGHVVDKRELLSAGLNVAPSGKDKTGTAADHLRASAQARQSAFSKRDFASEQAQRERQSRMINDQLEASAKRKREEELEQQARDERDAKSKKTDQDVSDAKARYLARKAARERGEG